MVEIKHALQEGFDTTKFVISTVTEKQKDGKFICRGKLIQGRGTYDEKGEVIWDDRVISSEVLSDNYIHADNTVLNALFKYLQENDFYLFDMVSESEDSKNLGGTNESMESKE